MRACEEVQGTFALTIAGTRLRVQGRGRHGRAIPDRECVSCGACVQACPTATLMEKSVVEKGQPEHSVVTTCAYCGVGCTFKAEMRGDQVVRMVPWKDGKANHGHSCVKGRFAWGYASHRDRILKPMIREKITDPWREVSWDEAIDRVASRIQAHPGEVRARMRSAASPRRAAPTRRPIWCRSWCAPAFGNNNIDTCARVCHSPTGYGLEHDVRHLGRDAGFRLASSRPT